MKAAAGSFDAKMVAGNDTRGCRGPIKTPLLPCPAAHLLSWEGWRVYGGGGAGGCGGCRWWRGRAGAWTPWMSCARCELRASYWHAGGKLGLPALIVVARAHSSLPQRVPSASRGARCSPTGAKCDGASVYVFVEPPDRKVVFLAWPTFRSNIRSLAIAAEKINQAKG